MLINPEIWQSLLQLNDGVVWFFDNPNINVFLSFTIKITASHLRKIRYTPYQYELWNICNSMREEGATFLAIAKYLNENGYKSARGKLFKNPHNPTNCLKRNKFRNQ